MELGEVGRERVVMVVVIWKWSLLIAGCRSTGSVRPEVAHAYVPA